MTDVRMIVYEALLEKEKNPAAGDIGKAVLDKYSYLDKQQRAFIHILYDGVIEKLITLDYVIDSVSKVPVRKMKKPVRTLIRMGAYQILYMDSVPDRAACNETVAIARKKHLDNLSGFINGVLRAVCRLEGKIEYPDRNKNMTHYLSVYYSMPPVIVESLIKDYSEAGCEKILDDLTKNRPLIGRTICSNTDRKKLLDALNFQENVSVSPVEGTDAFSFDSIDSLYDIPEFEDGLFTIQDLSSQLVGIVAGYSKGDTVIDVCAAPGGKSLHAADILNCLSEGDDSRRGRVISCDVSEYKTGKIEENIERCRLNNLEVEVADATVFEEKLKNSADVLLCDVPCSGFGVMARKRDISHSITEEGLASLVKLQRKILVNVVKYLKPGGTMVFSTCTMRKAENDDNFEFIKNELGLIPVGFYDLLPDSFREDTAKEGFLQLFAGRKNTDGFYIAKFRKSE